MATAVGDSSRDKVAAEAQAEQALVGEIGIAETDLFPGGQISINGKWYEAKVAVGTAEKGTRVRVSGRDGFSLLVKPIGEDEA